MHVDNLLDTAAGPKLVNKDFLPRGRKEAIKSIKSPSLRTESRKVVNFEGVVSLCVRIGDFHVWELFGIV